MIEKRKSPLGVKIISVFYYIASFFYLLTAFIAFFKNDIFTNLPGFNQSINNFPQAFTAFGTALLLLAVLSWGIAKDIKKLKKWALIAALALSLLWIIGGFLSIMEKSYISIINLAVNLLIFGYIILNKKTRRALLYYSGTGELE
jgi:hypothetical protein